MGTNIKMSNTLPLVPLVPWGGTIFFQCERISPEEMRPELHATTVAVVMWISRIKNQTSRVHQPYDVAGTFFLQLNGKASLQRCSDCSPARASTV